MEFIDTSQEYSINIIILIMMYFPYTHFRKGQREMLEFIFSNLKRGKASIVHAPTGIGKTASVLGASLKYAEDNNLKVFFLTNRHEHHRIVFETVKKINDRYKKNFVAVNLLNKRLLCNHEFKEVENSDFHDYCKALRKDGLCYFYTNTVRNGELTYNAKVALAKYNGIFSLNAEEIKNSLKDFCPYEIILEMIKRSHIIIADYYYIFNPVINKVFFGKTGLSFEDVVLIIDEAHNLPDRIRKMNSIALSSHTFSFAIKEAKMFYPSLVQDLINIGMDIELFLINKIRKADSQAYLERGDLLKIIERRVSYSALIDALYDISEERFKEGKRSYTNSLRKFLETWDIERESIVRIGERGVELGKWKIMMSDIDVSSFIEDVVSQCSGSVFMSATLYPLEMYRDVMGLTHKAEVLELPSPFPRTNHLAYIVRGITTKYELRNKDMFQVYGEVLSLISNNLPFNIIFFFPSYEIRDEILKYTYFTENKIILLERRDLAKEDKDNILSVMERENNVVLLAITGANFYEGVDFKGKMAQIVGIVGMPFQKPDLLTKSMIRYYDKIYNKGRLYGYIIPALNKVMQSAGRAIRGEREKGIILFLDERYLYPTYFRHIRKRYENIVVSTYMSLSSEVKNMYAFLMSDKIYSQNVG